MRSSWKMRCTWKNLERAELRMDPVIYDLIVAFHYLKEAHRKDGKGLFIGACSDRMKGNGILPNWEKINVNDHRLIMDALGFTQSNISLALSCIQAQMWMQTIAASIIGEGKVGIFPTEIQKIIWDSATDFEREFHSWWNLVNFTYNPITNTATAFVLTILNVSVNLILPIIALGLNHNGAVLYPFEHREWACQIGGKWQTVDLESCISWEQQGFICESNAIVAQDICLDTEQNICHFEVHPNETPETVLVYIDNGCACLRTACDAVFVENVAVNTKNHSNFGVCNFTEISGCDFFLFSPSYILPSFTNQLHIDPQTIAYPHWDEFYSGKAIVAPPGFN